MRGSLGVNGLTNNLYTPLQGGWLLPTERHWLLRKLFSQEPFKKVARMVLWNYFFNGNLTSLQSEGTCATSPSPLPCVSVKNSQETKERGSFFHWMGTAPPFFGNCSMEFLIGQKMELFFEKCIKEGPYDIMIFFEKYIYFKSML